MSLWDIPRSRRSLTEAERAAFAEALERITPEEFQLQWSEAESEAKDRLIPFRTKVTTQTLLQVVD